MDTKKRKNPQNKSVMNIWFWVVFVLLLIASLTVSIIFGIKSNRMIDNQETRKEKQTYLWISIGCAIVSLICLVILVVAFLRNNKKASDSQNIQTLSQVEQEARTLEQQSQASSDALSRPFGTTTVQNIEEFKRQAYDYLNPEKTPGQIVNLFREVQQKKAALS